MSIPDILSEMRRLLADLTWTAENMADAEAALKRMDAREPETDEEWASRLARELNASDRETER